MKRLTDMERNIKLLADENIPKSSIEFLIRKGIDVKTLPEYGKQGSKDKEVVELAIKEGRIILTQDLDFGKIYYFHKRGQVGVILLRIKPQIPGKVNRIMGNFFSKVDLEKENLTKTLMVVEERGYRILR